MASDDTAPPSDSGRDSEQLYRAIVETATEGIVMVDRDYCITFANDRFAEMLGIEVGSVRGRRIEEFATVEGRELIIEGRRQRLAGSPGRYEVPMQHADGSTVWCQLSAAPLVDDDGEVIGAVGMHTDVTERKLVEARFEAIAQNPYGLAATLER